MSGFLLVPMDFLVFIQKKKQSLGMLRALTMSCSGNNGMTMGRP